MVLNIWVKSLNKNINKLEKFIIILLFIIIAIVGAVSNIEKESETDNVSSDVESFYDISNIPQYNGKIYVKINDNVPTFTTEDINIEEDYYSDLKDKKVRNVRNGYDKN